MKLYFGKNAQGANVTLDLVEENLHCILLAGDEGTGKAFFHRSLYRDLTLGQSPSMLRFVFLDSSGRDTREWSHSPFLYAPIAQSVDESFAILEEVAQEAERRTVPIPGAYATIIVHIEENDLVHADRKKLEDLFARILRHQKTSNIFICYSTTEIEGEYLKSWLRRFIDLRVIFHISDPEKAKIVAGTADPSGYAQPGEHLLIYKGHRTRCRPFQKITSYL